MHVSKKKKGLTDLDGLPKQCEEGVADKTTGEEDEDADSTIGEEAEDSSDGEESEEGSPFDPYKLGSEVIVFDPSEGNRDGYGSDDTDYEGEQRDVYLKYRRQYRESEVIIYHYCLCIFFFYNYLFLMDLSSYFRDLILMIIPSQLREKCSLVLLVMSIWKMKMAFIPKAAERHLHMLSRNRIRRWTSLL